MSRVAKIILFAGLVACPFPLPAFAQATAALVPEAIQRCDAESFRIDDDVVCLRATITAEMADTIETHDGAISAIVLDTPGGDMASSLRIGRRLFRDKALIIVDGECSSSCANYLAPLGIKKLHVTEGSFIAMHGVPPRDLWNFIDGLRIASGTSVDDMVANPSLFFGWQHQYPEHVRNVVIPEVQYFADVNQNEAYATRFAEVMRTISMRSNYSCAPTAPALLVIGPQLMRQFRVNSQNVWWDDDRRAFIERLPASMRDYVLIIDSDEHPSWIPGRGFLTPADCTAPGASAATLGSGQ